jgi:p-methyltransferase
MMIKNDFGFSWYSYFRCAAARDKETYDLAYQSGCRAVFLGIESGDQRVLDNMSKVATLDRYRRGMDELHSRGITMFAAFIAGFPGESAQTIDNTISFIEDTRPTFFRVEPWWYNHRSPIHSQADKFSITGQGYQWKHSSMDVHQACDAMDHVFASVTGSMWMPLYNFDFWALPYLFSKGFDTARLLRFHESCRELMLLNDTAIWDGRAHLRAENVELQLTELFASFDLEDSKYRLPNGA